ncbi:MAG: substrate-binding domain-containing protein [Thermaerobacter sp.]|nr:substrate-binding domain-containing protein [Thermaerobacter sp.]
MLWVGRGLLAAVLCLAAGLAWPGPGAGRRVTLAGSTALLPLARAAAAAFMRGHPGVVVQVSGGGSLVGLAQVGAGAVDIGMAEVPAPPGSGLAAHPVALLPLVPVVHPGTGLHGLTREQLRGVLTGRSRNWRQLGGRNLRIWLVNRSPASGGRRALRREVLGSSRFSPRAMVMPSNGAVRQAVAATPGALGYLQAGTLGSGVVPLAYAGVPYTPGAVRRGRYPLVARGTFYTRGRPAGATAAFLAFVTGPFRAQLPAGMLAP